MTRAFPAVKFAVRHFKVTVATDGVVWSDNAFFKGGYCGDHFEC